MEFVKEQDTYLRATVIRDKGRNVRKPGGAEGQRGEG